MKVPPSHFPSNNKALGHVISGGSSSASSSNNNNNNNNNNNSTPFQLAMEHVHTISAMLEHTNNNNNSTTSQKTNTGGDEKQQEQQQQHKKRNRDSFIIKGGCPFKSYHRESSKKKSSINMNMSATNTPVRKRNLARSMEDFSLAAIMGRMATMEESSLNLEEGLDDDDVEEEEGRVLVRENDDVGVEKELFIGDQESDEAIVDASDEKTVQPTVGGDNSSSIATTTPSPAEQPQQQQQRRGSHGSQLSQALKSGTAKSHTAAENVHFVNNFIQGKIDRELYMDLITGLYHTYVTLEQLLHEYAPKYFPSLYFPKELNRMETLEEDMEYWHGLNWKMKRECCTPTAAVQDYIDRMKEVGRLDPLLLLSHAYTRYLGDLSGGKVLSRIARRALNLSKGYDGLAFYNFEHIKSAKLFKDMYRQALDELVLTSNEVGKVVAEANVAFALNMRVFEELDVKGGVEGAYVRNVAEALSYYDIEMEEQKQRGRSGSFLGDDDNQGKAVAVAANDDGEEEKCPFGFKGPNPHKMTMTTKTDSVKEEDVPKSQSSNVALIKQTHAEKEGGGRCPWPFVFFHDPAMGMKDWQTWFCIGLVLCYCWSCIK